MLKLTDPYINLTDDLLMNCNIGSMEIFQLDRLLLKKQMPTVNSTCSCSLLKISSRGTNGWGECILSTREKRIDLIQWSSVFIKLKGLPLPIAIEWARNKRELWGEERCALAESALLHLAWQIQNPDHQITANTVGAAAIEKSFLIDQSQSYFSF